MNELPAPTKEELDNLLKYNAIMNTKDEREAVLEGIVATLDMTVILLRLISVEPPFMKEFEKNVGRLQQQLSELEANDRT